MSTLVTHRWFSQCDVSCLNELALLFEIARGCLNMLLNAKICVVVVVGDEVKNISNELQLEDFKREQMCENKARLLNHEETIDCRVGFFRNE